MATFYWRGSAGSFDLPSGWFIAGPTGALSPADRAPGGADIVVFDTVGMALSAGASVTAELRLDLPVAAGTLNLDGHTLALHNTAQLGDVGSSISGPGTLETDAVSAVPAPSGGGAALQLVGGATWSNAGLVMVAGVVEIGVGLGDTATVVNQGGGLFALAVDQTGQVTAAAGGRFVNDGTLEKTGGSGVSAVTAPVTNAGVVVANSGTLALTGGGVLGGTIGGGAGDVLLAGSFDLAAGGTQSVWFASGAQLGAGADGAAVLHGAGTLASSGTVRLTGSSGPQVELAGGVTWRNGGTVIAAGDLAFGAGRDSGTLVNQAGASVRFAGDSGFTVQPSGAAGLLVNAGTLSKTNGSGTSRIAVPVEDTGRVVVNSGTLAFDAGGSFAGSLSGSGALAFDGGIGTLAAEGRIATGELLINGGTLLTATGSSPVISSDIAGADGTLRIAGNSNLTVAGAVAPSQTILFDGAGATLTVADVRDFTPAAIGGFGPGDVLRVTDTAANVAARLPCWSTWRARASSPQSVHQPRHAGSGDERRPDDGGSRRAGQDRQSLPAGGRDRLDRPVRRLR